MAQSLASLLTVSNMGISGDIGPLTCYNTATGKIITFPVSPPKEPPSAAQLVMRSRWRQAMQTWSSLSSEQQTAWKLVASRGRLKLSAINLWLWYQVTMDRSIITTLERQTGVTLPGI